MGEKKGEKEISRCEVALSVLADLVGSECTAEQLGMWLKEVLGLEDDDINVSETCRMILEEKGLTKEVCQDFRAYRRWVMCRAFQLIEKEGLSFSEALRRAWKEVKSKCFELGVTI